jgi:hypothetical protein
MTSRLESVMAVAVRRMIDRSSRSDARHLARIEAHVHDRCDFRRLRRPVLLA